MGFDAAIQANGTPVNKKALSRFGEGLQFQ